MADPEQVQVLDFATGTGTFLHEAMQQIFEEPGIATSKALQQSLVTDHILKNFYGFEYLIASYTIAHLKLSQFLKDKGLEVEQPLQVLLTNTLEMQPSQGNFPFMQTLKEGRKQKGTSDKGKTDTGYCGQPPLCRSIPKHRRY